MSSNIKVGLKQAFDPVRGKGLKCRIRQLYDRSIQFASGRCRARTSHVRFDGIRGDLCVRQSSLDHG
jgi:hypothetical protein